MHLHPDRLPAGPSTGRPPGEPGGRRVHRLLRSLPLFDGLLGPDDEALFDDAGVVSLAAGAVVFEAGQPAQTLYVIVQGRVRLQVGPGVAMRTVAMLERGETVGLAALLPDDLYTLTAAAADEVLLVGLPGATIRRTIERHPVVAVRLIAEMGAKLARIIRELGGAPPRTARARVARMLLELNRTTVDDGSELAYDEPKRVIAARLAMTPETLSRELNALAALGLIESRRTRVRVLDATGLARAAADATGGGAGVNGGPA
jgi:CRP-like cAMP-binding protein